MKKEGIRVLYSDINSFKQPNETVWKAYKDAFQNWLAHQTDGSNWRKHSVQFDSTVLFWTAHESWNWSSFAVFLYHIYRDPEPWKRTAPYHRLLRLFIYSSITLSIHSSIIHPSIQLPHKYLLNVFPLMELTKNDEIYYGAIILEITRNKINGVKEYSAVYVCKFKQESRDGLSK